MTLTEEAIRDALEYLEAVYDRDRAPNSPNWEETKPRVEKYLRHLYRGPERVS
jgi:hypothetical protein